MLRRNLHLLYALVYSSSNSSPVSGGRSSGNSSSGSGSGSKKGDILGPFRERWFEQDFESQVWASELCSLADPLVDVVEFMQVVLAKNAHRGEDYSVARAAGGGGGGGGADSGGGCDLETDVAHLLSAAERGNAGSAWTSVEAVMEVLEEGARSYRTKREALCLDAVEDGLGGVNEAGSAAAAAFVYEETAGAAAFFLPYTWSLTVDMTRDLGWHSEDIVLFPSVPYFESWEEEEVVGEFAGEGSAVKTQQSGDLPPI
jgi:hypothetical protein